MKPQTSPTLKPSFNVNQVSLKPLGPAVSTAGKMKINALQSSTTPAPGAMKSGPMKAFTSPESVTGGATKSSHTSSVRKKASGGDSAHVDCSSHRTNMNKSSFSREIIETAIGMCHVISQGNCQRKIFHVNLQRKILKTK